MAGVAPDLRAAGMTRAYRATKKTCLDYVEKTWTDMRPLSLRKWMAEQEAQQSRPSQPGTQDASSAN